MAQTVLRSYLIDEQLESESRYKFLYRLVLSNGDRVIESYDKPIISSDNTDVFFKVPPGFENRLDLIAQRYYNNSELYWILALANDYKDPFNTCKVGDIIYIPSASTIYGYRGIL